MRFALRVVPEVVITLIVVSGAALVISLMVYDTPATKGSTISHIYGRVWPAFAIVATIGWFCRGMAYVCENRDKWIKALDTKEQRRIAETQRAEDEIDAILKREKVL